MDGIDFAALARGARMLEAEYAARAETAATPETERRYRDIADDYAVFASELEHAAADRPIK